MHNPFRNDDAGVPLAGIHLMDAEVLEELGELGLCGTAEGEKEEWGGEGMTPPPPPPHGESMKDDQRMAQETQRSTGIPHLECGSKKSNDDPPDEQVSIPVDPQYILENAVFIDSVEGDQHVAQAYVYIKNLQLGVEDEISMTDEDDVITNDELFPADNQEPFIHFQPTALGEGLGLSDLKMLHKSLYPSKQLFPMDNQEPFIHFQPTTPGEGLGLSDLKMLRKMAISFKIELLGKFDRRGN
jgi:hypothetical protein